MSGRKMAKSAGNFERVTELAERGIDPLALRYLALTSRYRHKLDYSEESIESAAAGLESLRARLRVLGPPPVDGPWAAPAALRAAPAGERPDGIATDAGGHGGIDTPGSADRAHAPSAPLSPEGRAMHDRFIAALDDDLDTSSAVAIARETLRAPLSEDERRWLLLDFDYVLGLDLDDVWATGTAADDTPAEVRELVGGARDRKGRPRLRPRRRPPRRARNASVGTSSTARTARRHDRRWQPDEGRADAPVRRGRSHAPGADVAQASRPRGGGGRGGPRLDLRRGSRHLPWRPHGGDPRGLDRADSGGRRHQPRRGRSARAGGPVPEPCPHREDGRRARRGQWRSVGPRPRLRVARAGVPRLRLPVRPPGRPVRGGAPDHPSVAPRGPGPLRGALASRRHGVAAPPTAAPAAHRS